MNSFFKIRIGVNLLSTAMIVFFFSGCMAQAYDKETQFWRWFIANNTRYYEQKEPQEKLFDELSKQLSKVNANITFEFSPIDSHGVREFTVSGDGLRDYFPVVQSLVNKAPKIDKWKINAFRQRVPGDSINLKCRKTKIGYNDIYFRYAFDSGKIAIELNVRNFIDTPAFKQAVYILLDGLIGEYDMETQVSSIEFVELDESKTKVLTPIVMLRNLVDEKKHSNSN